MNNNAILRRFDELEAKISSLMDSAYTVEAAAKYLGVSRSTLYQLTSNNKIAFSKPNGGKLLFLKSDLDDYVRRGHVESASIGSYGTGPKAFNGRDLKTARTPIKVRQ